MSIVGPCLKGLKTNVDVKTANRIAMRALALVLLIAARPALAQDEAGAAAGDCNVYARPVDINDRGELARPPPTLEECAAAEALIDKLLSMDRRDFRRIVELEPIPGNVRVQIGRLAPYGSPWNSSAIPSDLPNQRLIVTHLSDSIVIVVYESADIAGIATSVLIADLTTLKACNYPRWPETRAPRALGVEDIQAVLDKGLAGDRPTPTCYLRPLAIEVLNEGSLARPR